MAQLSQNRAVASIFSPNRHDFGRYSISQTYGSDFSGHGYQDNQLETQHLQSQSAMQGIATHYEPYLQHTARSHPAYHPSEHHRVLSYEPHQAQPPTHPQPMLDPMAHYQSRTTSILGSIGNGYQLPSYLNSTDQSAVCIATRPPQYLTSQPGPTTYEPALLDRRDSTSSFPPLSSPYAGHDPLLPQARTEPGPVCQEPELQQHEEQLKATFEAILGDRLNEASERLLVLSQGLLSSIVQLDMHVDNPDQYHHRLLFWREFNHGWEALAQRQHHLATEERKTRQRTHDTLDSKRIQQMVDKLISLCDQVDQFGLVDYEMGVWEDQIVAAFEACLDLTDRFEDIAGDERRQQDISTQ